MSTIRLTVAQALVRFLAEQHSERDGVRERLIAERTSTYLTYLNANGLGRGGAA
jgi:3D-(3,5/4)-trihydroxycyclohexane-1,2-dione acylhydrolase (decyclizing)